MNIQVDYYYRFHDEPRHDNIELPDNTVIVPLHWVQFSRPLERYVAEGKNDYLPEEMCQDYYIFIPDVKPSDADIKSLLKNHSEHMEYMFFSNGILMRLFSVDIPGYINFKTLEDLNNIVDFSDQYYVYKKSGRLENNDDIVLFRDTLSGKCSQDECITIMKLLHENTDIVLSYMKIVRIVNDGLYVKKVGILHMHGNYPNDSIVHHIESIHDMSQEIEKYGNEYKIVRDTSIIDKFEKRIQEIINI